MVLPLLIGGALADSAFNDGKVTKAVTGAAGDVGKGLTGNGRDAGILGVGQYRPTTHTIDKNNFSDPYSDQTRQDLTNRRAATDARTAPTMGGTRVGPVTNARMVTAAPSERVQGATLGPAAQGQATSLNRGDLEARGYQTDLLNALKAQAAGSGPGQELADKAFQQANDTALKNAMALAASRRGSGGPSLAAVLDSAATAQRDNASTLAQDKLKAQLAAQDQLGNLASGTRGQDLEADTTNASLADAAAGRNQAAANQFGLAAFDAANNIALNNAGRADQMSALNANLAADIGKTNAGFANQANLAQSDLDFKTKEANLEAYLKNQGMNDEQAQFYTKSLMAQNEADRQANEDYEKLLTTQETGKIAAEERGYEAAAANRGKLLSSGGGMIAGLFGMSDRNKKTKITSLDELYSKDTNWRLS